MREEDWTLDPLGNWPGYVQKTSGTTDLDQARTDNKANEITAITATTGTNWADPVYDRAGNMTTIPKPCEPGRRPDRRLRRLEPPGRSPGRRDDRSPTTTTTP